MKLSSNHDDNQAAAPNGNASGASSDHELLTREDLKYSVKIFLRSLEPEILTQAIDTGLDLPNENAWSSFVNCLVLSELKENYLESVMISLPNYGAQLTLSEFMPLWHVVEDYIDKQKLLAAGVCDFMLPLLSGLCDAAKVIDVQVSRDEFPFRSSTAMKSPSFSLCS